MNDLTQTSAEIAILLAERNETVAVAESSTGGLIAASLLAVPGASSYFTGGSVIYTLASRRELLGIHRADVDGLEPLTEAMVMRFAQRAKEQLSATWGIAELGVAGPTGARYGHPAGISVIGISGPLERSATITTASADRQQNMWRFTDAALNLLRTTLSNNTGTNAKP